MSEDKRALRSDAEIARATVGELRPHDRVITLRDYDPTWPALFERERDRIRAALADSALAIEHVGSTAVPGLVAKPIIDVVVAVADSAVEDGYMPALEAVGYVLRIREPGWHEHRMFLGPDTASHIHVFTMGDPEIERMVEFRDRLRNNDDDRDRYAAAKQRLATRRWRHVQHYADAKSGVIELILSQTPS